MLISGISSANMINNMSSVQTKAKGDFAERLASATEKAEVSQDDAKLKAACKDMEAMFLNLMMKEMRNTVHKSTLVDSSKEEIITSMLDSETTKNMASAGGIGLADMLYHQLRTTTSVAQKPQAPK